MVSPGEEELPLLAGLTSRSDARVVAVVDPDGNSLGGGLAEVMGIPVVRDLEDIPSGQAQYLIYPALSENVAPFVDLAPAVGLEPMTTREFTRTLENPTQGSRINVTQRLPLTDHEDLEVESAAIHRTLSRIEEALDREGLLRWLLGLAIRATGSDSGSIMLLDNATEELYVAFAEGLSQQTMLRTRVRMGEGIAGKVALSRKAELITSNKHPGARRDRSGNGSAICAPLVWDGKLLGVINLSAQPDTGDLNPDALKVVESLSHRFGLILDRFLRIQRVRDGELFRVMEEGLLREKRNPEALAATLTAWAGDLAEVAGASRASLSVLTADGDLFTATPQGSHYESPPDSIKAEALSSGKAIVLRPGDLLDRDPADDLREETVFHLPVGTDPVRALFSVEFTVPGRAHHFRSISGDILMLVGRHLEDILDRAQAADQIDRLTTLAATLSDLVLMEEGGLSEQRVLVAAKRLTGARQAVLLEGPPAEAKEEGSLVSPDIARAGVELLRQTGRRGWNSTVLTSEDHSGTIKRAVLAVPLGPERPFPGLLLWDKERLQPLDAAGFSELDVLFVRRLLPLLPVARQQRLTPSLRPASSTKSSQPVHGSVEQVLPILEREMDRCDRYHTCLGLAVFRPVGSVADGTIDTESLARELTRHLRSSDMVFALAADILLVLVPEDVQSLSRLQKRLLGVLRQLTGKSQVDFNSATRTYPGSAASPATLLESALTALT